MGCFCELTLAPKMHSQQYQIHSTCSVVHGTFSSTFHPYFLFLSMLSQLTCTIQARMCHKCCGHMTIPQGFPIPLYSSTVMLSVDQAQVTRQIAVRHTLNCSARTLRNPRVLSLLVELRDGPNIHTSKVQIQLGKLLCFLLPLHSNFLSTCPLLLRTSLVAPHTFPSPPHPQQSSTILNTEQLQDFYLLWYEVWTLSFHLISFPLYINLHYLLTHHLCCLLSFPQTLISMPYGKHFLLTHVGLHHFLS